MPKFSTRSLKARAELHPKLQEIVDEAIKHVDFVILDAQRGRAEQEKAFRGGFSKAHFGQSAHNFSPAVAFDLCPFPINFNDAGLFRKIAQTIGQFDAGPGLDRGIAADLKIPLRWGGDWDMDGDWKDERFLDWGHFELHPWRDWAKSSQLIGD